MIAIWSHWPRPNGSRWIRGVSKWGNTVISKNSPTAPDGSGLPSKGWMVQTNEFLPWDGIAIYEWQKVPAKEVPVENAIKELNDEIMPVKKRGSHSFDQLPTELPLFPKALTGQSPMAKAIVTLARREALIFAYAAFRDERSESISLVFPMIFCSPRNTSSNGENQNCSKYRHIVRGRTNQEPVTIAF